MLRLILKRIIFPYPDSYRDIDDFVFNHLSLAFRSG